MSGYTPTITYEADFEGDHVVFKLRRLKRKMFNRVLSEIDLGQADDQGDLAVKMTTADSLRLMSMIADELKDYVVSMEGLRTSDGADLGFDEVVEQAYFQELVMGLVGFLMEHSSPTKDEGKNSNAPSPTSSMGLVPEAQSS